MKLFKVLTKKKFMSRPYAEAVYVGIITDTVILSTEHIQVTLSG